MRADFRWASHRNSRAVIIVASPAPRTPQARPCRATQAWIRDPPRQRASRAPGAALVDLLDLLAAAEKEPYGSAASSSTAVARMPRNR